VIRRLLACLCVVWLLGAAAAPAAAAELLISTEAVPGGGFRLPALAEADFGTRERLNRVAARRLVPEIARAVGIDPARLKGELPPGGFMLRTNPSVQLTLDAPAREVDRLAAALGFVFSQSSVLVSDLADRAGGTAYGVVSFETPVKEGPRAHAFFLHAAGVAKGLGGGYAGRDGALLFLNLRPAPGRPPFSGLDDPAFQAALAKAAGSFAAEPARIASTGVARAWLIENDWRQQARGQAYLGRIGGDARTLNLLQELRERHIELARSFVDTPRTSRPMTIQVRFSPPSATSTSPVT